MLIFFGLFALIFYCSAIGWIWPGPSHSRLSEAIVVGVGKSLWISWALVVAYYFVGPLPAGGFIAAVGIWGIFLVGMGGRGATIDYTLFELAACSTGVALLVAWAALLVTGSISHYDLGFHDWDALVSWNRWALELAAGHYTPYNGYPVLFPGLWSLIYEAQGDSSIWILAKLSLFICPLVAVLSVVNLSNRGIVSGIVGIGFVVLFFVAFHSTDLLNGYMDMPVATMIFASVGLLVMGTDAQASGDTATYYRLMVGAGVFAGIASVTKQAGAVAILVVIVVLAMAVWQRHLSVKKAGAVCLVTLFPIGSYLLMYDWVHTDKRGEFAYMSAVSGNFSYLARLAAVQAGDVGVTRHALNVFVAMLGMPLSVILLAAGALNIVNVKRPQGRVGCFLFVSALVCFFAFANCCSYDARNGWWLLSLLVPSAILSVSSIEAMMTVPILTEGHHSINRIAIPGSLAAAAIGAGIIGSFWIGDSSIRKLQEESQSTIVSPAIAKLVNANRALLGGDGVLISPLQPLGWLPGLGSYYRLCFADSIDCVEEMMASASKTLILVGDQPSFDYKEIRGALPVDKLLGVADGFELYGPFKKGDHLMWSAQKKRAGAT